MDLGIIILAAGKGTRMRSRRPKVLHTLAGRPLLRHVLDTARQLAPRSVAVVYGHGGIQVPEAFAGLGLAFVEQPEQLGTGHAVAQALHLMEGVGRVLVLYGDVPLTSPHTLERLIAESADAPLGVLTALVSDPAGYGRVVRGPGGAIIRIAEERDASEAELEIGEINTGIMLFDRGRLGDWLSRVDNRNAQGEYYLTDTIGLAVAEGVAVASARPDGEEEVLGVNDRLQLARLERVFQRREAERLLLGGTALADPDRFDLRGTLTTGLDVFIDVNAVIEGEVELGDGVSVGPNCHLKDCRLGAGTRVLANTVIEDAVVGRDARIGPFSRIRPGTELGDGVHVGNFVELKKSRVGTGSKVNHLSYVGDSRVGSGVNVGAGTITCNYDGANKHLTVIDDDAFIGSNTALVAPVTVGAGATIGAGSVITRDAPAGKLSLARGRQVTVEGWARPRKKA
jgi:bifunctional UDP-N-acetylglucosamine pyrophosphorylase/glucosamine-1-phosphate N-acetyltransferase